MNSESLYETMSTLRAVRRQRNKPIPRPTLERILQAGVWAPSGGNTQPWRIVVVEDEAKKKALQELYEPEWKKYTAGYMERLKGLDGTALEKQKRTLAAGDQLAANFHHSPAILMFCFHPGLMAITDAGLDRPSVVGGASVYPAMQNVLLACRAENIGCTITTLLCFREAEVRALLEIPDPWYTAAAVPIGYAEGKGHGPINRRSVQEMSFANTWSQPWEV